MIKARKDVRGKNMAENTLVVKGGKLIDGTGRTPVDDAVIVIQNGRFAAVGRSGPVAVPAGTEVIDVKGKTILPGLIYGHGHH
jgi:imidazolonepropionase-like amidohydrolase